MAVEPLTQEMKLAWAKFKSTKLFGALISHVDAQFIIENEGFLWCLFYNGYLAGWSSDKKREYPAEQTDSNEVDLRRDIECGKGKADGGNYEKQNSDGGMHEDSYRFLKPILPITE